MTDLGDTVIEGCSETVDWIQFLHPQGTFHSAFHIPLTNIGDSYTWEFLSDVNIYFFGVHHFVIVWPYHFEKYSRGTFSKHTSTDIPSKI